MNRQKLWVLILLPLALLVTQCSNDDDDRVQIVNLNQPFTLQYFETARLRHENFEVTFRGTAIEMRDPNQVGYLYPGYAEATIAIKSTGQPEQSFQLGIIGASSEDDWARLRAKWNDYFFELRALEPSYPIYRLNKPATSPMPPIRAELMITRSGPPDSLTGTVIFADPYAHYPFDQYGITAAAMSADTLVIDVEYGGGCKNHYFFLYMAPRTFMESNPVQANLYLRHYKNNDNCRDGDCDGGRCWIERRLRFDLTPIRELHESIYSASGPIILNLYQYFDTEPGEKFVVTYGE